MKARLCKLPGTMIMIVPGDGVVAIVTMKKSGMKGTGLLHITFAWFLTTAVLLPAARENINGKKVDFLLISQYNLRRLSAINRKFAKSLRR